MDINTHGSEVMDLLRKASQIMMAGSFSERDLKYIKEFLNALLKATENAKKVGDENRR